VRGATSSPTRRTAGFNGLIAALNHGGVADRAILIRTGLRRRFVELTSALWEAQILTVWPVLSDSLFSSSLPCRYRFAGSSGRLKPAAIRAVNIGGRFAENDLHR
jgi:hypothetical protein